MGTGAVSYVAWQSNAGRRRRTMPRPQQHPRSGWGEKGYFRLRYGTGNGGLCGIATTASYPVGAPAGAGRAPSRWEGPRH